MEARDQKSVVAWDEKNRLECVVVARDQKCLKCVIAHTAPVTYDDSSHGLGTLQNYSKKSLKNKIEGVNQQFYL